MTLTTSTTHHPRTSFYHNDGRMGYKVNRNKTDIQDVYITKH